MLKKILELSGYYNFEEYGEGNNRFAIWSGDETLKYKKNINQIFNNPNNKDGSLIKIILGSPSIKEGVSLKRVRAVHILDPYWNWSRLDQIIGRAIRYCSHKDLPMKERIVNIYKYYTIIKDIETTDIKIKNIADKKEKINN
jgi:hypothetical protein